MWRNIFIGGFQQTLYFFLYTNEYLYNQCIKLFYLFYIHHCSIYILDHIRRPFLIKICCSMVRNVPSHEKNVSVKFQWNRFIFRWSTKPLKNAFFKELGGTPKYRPIILIFYRDFFSLYGIILPTEQHILIKKGRLMWSNIYMEQWCM